MSSSLTCISRESVAEGVRARIIEDSITLMGSHEWWCEALFFFFSPDHPEQLVGDAKLFLLGYSDSAGEYVEVDPDEDTLMACRDANVIVDALCRWSRVHGLSWEVQIAGESIGCVERGSADRSLRRHLSEMRAASPLDDARIPEVLVRHAARIDDAGMPTSDDPPPSPTAARRSSVSGRHGAAGRRPVAGPGGRLVPCVNCRASMRLGRWTAWNGFLVPCGACRRYHGKRWSPKVVAIASILLLELSFFFTMRPAAATGAAAVLLASSWAALRGAEVLQSDSLEIVGYVWLLLGPLLVNGVMLVRHQYLLGKHVEWSE